MELDAIDLHRLAAHLGIEVTGRGAERRAKPCPACGSRTGFGISPSLWHCFACDRKGRALDLVVLAGAARDRADAVAWLRRAGLVADNGAPVRRRRLASDTAQSRKPAKPLPPRDAVASVWSKARPIVEHDDASEWTRSRGLDPDLVTLLDVARVLVGGPPTWLYRGTHRVIFPLFDASGAHRSFRCRSWLDPKPLAPRGFTVCGLTLADPLAQRMLAGEADAAQRVTENGIVVVEGETDFLTWATHYGDGARLLTAPAVLGTYSGGWSSELAGRIPDGTTVTIRTDNDRAGDRYAAQIHSTLWRRCKVLRLQPEGDQDGRQRPQEGGPATERSDTGSNADAAA